MDHQLGWIALGLLPCALISFLLSRRVKTSTATWYDTIERLRPISTAGITLIALEYRNPGCAMYSTGQISKYTLIGGMRGLIAMRVNATVFLALASQAEYFQPAESAEIVLELRHGALELRKATYRILLGRVLSFGIHGGVQIQKAAAAYERMLFLLVESESARQSFAAQHLRRVIWRPDILSG